MTCFTSAFFHLNLHIFEQTLTINTVMKPRKPYKQGTGRLHREYLLGQTYADVTR